MLIKKVSSISLFLLVLSNIMTAQGSQSTYDGFYIGSGVGASWLGSDNDNVGNSPAGLFDVFLGYGHVVRERFYLGGELGANIYFNQDNDNYTGTSSTSGLSFYRDFAPRYGFFTRVKPGVLITPKLLVFTSLGAGLTRLDFDADNVNPSGVTTSGVSQHSWIYNVSIGGGAEYALWKGLSIGAEYNYLYYPKQTYYDQSGDKRESTFNANQVKANLIYRFG